MPNVYVNTEFISAIFANYNPNTREIVASEEGMIIEITRDVINEVFMVNPNTIWAIDPLELDLQYKQNEKIYRRILASFSSPGTKGDDGKLTS